MDWGASIIADMHARGDHRGCGLMCKAPVAVAPPVKPKRGRQMNKTEARWAAVLEADPTVQLAVFEPVTLRLADRCTYRPDFLVVYRDGALGFDEIKGGFSREDAIVKLKVAAEQFPFFRWRKCVWKGGRWNVEALT